MSDRQRKSGADFEVEMAKFLSEYGYWVHRFAPNINGQPADLIAVDKYEDMLIDCKVCENNYFLMSRVEPNQITAMTAFKTLTNGDCYFVLKTDFGIYFIDSGVMMSLKNKGVKKLSRVDIKKYGIEQGEFL